MIKLLQNKQARADLGIVGVILIAVLALGIASGFFEITHKIIRNTLLMKVDTPVADELLTGLFIVLIGGWWFSVRRWRELQLAEKEHENAKDALQHTESRLGQLLRSANAVIYRCEPRAPFAVVSITSNAEQLFGYSAQEFTSGPSLWISNVHPEDRAKLSSAGQFVDSDRHVREYRFRKPDGEFSWIRDDIRVSRNAKGDWQEFVGFCIDISDRKSIEAELEHERKSLETRVAQRTRELLDVNRSMSEEVERRQDADAELRASEQRLKVLTEHAPEAIIVYDFEKEMIVEVNKSAAELFKQDRNKLLAMSLAQLGGTSVPAGADLPPPLLRAVPRAIAGKTATFDWNFFAANGDAVWSAARLIRVPGLQETLLRLSLVDVSRERMLVQEASQLGQILNESLNEIYIFRENDLRFLSVNFGAQENLGYSMAELDELTPLDLQPQFTRAFFLELTGPLRMGTRKRVKHSSRHQRKDGSTYPVEVDIQLSMFLGKRAYVAYVVDVTEQRATEAKLHRAQRMESVGQLTGGIAHDFNNLLTVVIGNLQLLDESDEHKPEQAAMIDDALESATRGAELTRRLLAFARKQILEPAVTEINELLSEMKRLLQRTLGEGIDIDLVTGDSPVLTTVDVSQLESAVLNLAINARDAMPEGGRLTIEAQLMTVAPGTRSVDGGDNLGDTEIEPGEYAVISVSDTGTGIDADVLKHVFDPFFSTKDVGKGSGLGLSMVFGFVKQSDGYVTIASELGQGTRISLYFRRSVVDEQAEAANETVTQALPSGSETILMVEDDVAVRKLGTQLLSHLGYRVLEAGDGASALEILNSDQHIDLLFTDIVMPGMGGPDLAVKARDCRPGLKILFTTGFTDSAVFRTQIMDEAANLLDKPYSKETLAGSVRQALNAY